MYVGQKGTIGVCIYLIMVDALQTNWWKFFDMLNSVYVHIINQQINIMRVCAMVYLCIIDKFLKYFSIKMHHYIGSLAGCIHFASY